MTVSHQAYLVVRRPHRKQRPHDPYATLAIGLPGPNENEAIARPTKA